MLLGSVDLVCRVRFLEMDTELFSGNVWGGNGTVRSVELQMRVLQLRD